MSMTKEELFDIFREYASKEFESIPQNESEIDHEFSEKFNKKMQKLIEKVEYKLNHTISKTAKNILILVAAIIMLFAGLMSVGAIREPFVDIILEKYDRFIDLFFVGDTSKTIDHIYSFHNLPESFDKTGYSENENTVHTEYIDSITGDRIILNQSTTESNQMSVDTEMGETIVLWIDDEPIYIYKNNSDSVMVAIWTNETYAFSFAYYGNISEEKLIEFIKSLS